MINPLPAPSTMEDPSNIGNRGEKAFAALCAECGIVATRPDQDKNGWDFFVELPEINQQDRPADKTLETIRCLVQVKASSKSIRRVTAKLSALKHLVAADLPAFVVFCLYTKQRNVPRIFVRHVDHQVMESVLRRLREAVRDGEQQRLHKIRVGIPFAHEATEILSPSDLVAQFRSQIPKGVQNYLANKDRNKQWLGYDSIPMSVTLSASRHPYVELIEHDLGLTQHLHTTSLVIRDRRFDIEVDQPLLSLGEGRLSFANYHPQVFNAASITIGNDPLDPLATFPASLHTSRFNTWVPPHLQRFRLSGDWFDMVVTPFADEYSERIDEGQRLVSGKGTIELRHLLNPCKSARLPELCRTLRTMDLLESASEVPVVIRLRADGRDCLEAILSNPRGFPSVSYELGICRSLIQLLNSYQIDASSLDVSCQQLSANRQSLEMLTSAYNRTLAGSRVSAKFHPALGAAVDVHSIGIGHVEFIDAIHFGSLSLIYHIGFALRSIVICLESAAFSGDIDDPEVRDVSLIPRVAVESDRWIRRTRQGESPKEAQVRLALIGSGVPEALQERVCHRLYGKAHRATQ